MKDSGNCLFQGRGGGSSLTSCLLRLFSYPGRGKKLFLPLILRPVRVSSVFCSLPPSVLSIQWGQLCLPETALLPVACGWRPHVQCSRLSRVGPYSPSVALLLHPNPIARLSRRWEVLCCLALPSPASAARRPYISLLSVLLTSPPWPKGPVAFVLACLKLHFLLDEASSGDICPFTYALCLSLSLLIASHLLRSSVLHN